MPPLDSIAKAIEEEISVRRAENIEAARDAYHEVELMGLITAETPLRG